MQFENGFFGSCEQSYRVISAGFFPVLPGKNFMKMMLQRNSVSWLSKKNKERKEKTGKHCEERETRGRKEADTNEGNYRQTIRASDLIFS